MAASPPSTVGALLAGAALPPREARALLAEVLAVARETLIAHPDRAVNREHMAKFLKLVHQRTIGVPIAYLLGHQEFYGRRFRVDPAVLVPRPETELLVEVVLTALGARRGARILDLGTGSGCIAISLALDLESPCVVAIDRSAAALQRARANGTALGAIVDWRESDWYAGLPQASGADFDAIVSNPPYVAHADPHLAALHAEPLEALAAGADGLDALRQVVGGARPHLVAGGLLVVEHGYDQGASVRTLFRDAGFVDVETRRDGADLPRACVGYAGRG